MGPAWLPDAVGTLAGILLALPAWRAGAILKEIDAIERRANARQAAATRPDYVDDATASRKIADTMLGVVRRWSRVDDLMLKSGVVLLAVSFAIRLF